MPPTREQPDLLRLPNGSTVTVTPSFGGFTFKSNELAIHPSSPTPPGWSIILQHEPPAVHRPVGAPHDGSHGQRRADSSSTIRPAPMPHSSSSPEPTPHHSPPPPLHPRPWKPWRRPSLQEDTLYISTVSTPAASDFTPAPSPARQHALMLWTTLCWYFHQPEPPLHLSTPDLQSTPLAARSKGDWRVQVKREGKFKGGSLPAKLERMGLVLSFDSSAGSSDNDLFCSRRVFWQLDARLFLFTLKPGPGSSLPGSPIPSRPPSPGHADGHLAIRGGASALPRVSSATGMDSLATEIHRQGHSSGSRTPSYHHSHTPGGPFYSTSHLPTYYPPPPLLYAMSDNIRHPVRPKAPHPGEIFYTRFIPSLGQYLSFRVASLSPDPIPHRGPTSDGEVSTVMHDRLSHIGQRGSSSGTPSITPPVTKSSTTPHPPPRSDADLLHAWHNNPRVSAHWGCHGDISVQRRLLETGLASKHSFPAIALLDAHPFAYLELYYLFEDPHLGPFLPHTGDDLRWDRGFHVAVGEEQFRGQHRVKAWVSGVVHWCFLADSRCGSVWCEPRVDNVRFIELLEGCGFRRVGEVSLRNKQAMLMRIRRDDWEGPSL